jgi:toxin ParE1/3/4
MAHSRAPEVDLDLDEIWYYVAKNTSSVEIADRLVNSITDRFHLLAKYPQMGRARDDLRTGLRSFPVGEYVLIYRIEQGDAVILRVLRGSRNIHVLFGR